MLPLLFPAVAGVAGYLAGGVKRRFKRRTHDARTAVTGRMRSIDPWLAITRRKTKSNPEARKTERLQYLAAQPIGYHTFGMASFETAIRNGHHVYRQVYAPGHPATGWRKLPNVKSNPNKHRRSVNFHRTLSAGGAASRLAHWRWHHNPAEIHIGDRVVSRLAPGKSWGRGVVTYIHQSSGKYKVRDDDGHADIPGMRSILDASPLRKKRNPETEAHELALYTVNEADLYRQRAQPIMTNLRKKIRKGTYDAVKALKLWAYLADAGAQKYTKEIGEGGPNGSYGIFSKADRALAAKELAEHYEDELGQSNPVHRKRAHGRLLRTCQSNPPVSNRPVLLTRSEYDSLIATDPKTLLSEQCI